LQLVAATGTGLFAEAQTISEVEDLLSSIIEYSMSMAPDFWYDPG
jgi:hypothetical protein